MNIIILNIGGFMEKRDAIKFVIEALEVRSNMGYSINEILNKDGIEKLLFNTCETCSNIKCVEIDIFNYLRSKQCDMSEISFDNVMIKGLDFTGFTGVKIDPFRKNLTMCTFNGVEFIGPFYGARIDTTDFTGSKGAIIDVSKLSEKSIVNSKMSDVTFIGSFENADLFEANFKGSVGAKINPKKLLFNDGLAGTVLDGVEFTEPISNCCIDRADFTGSKNAVILADNIDSFRNIILTDAIVIGELNDKDCTGMVTDGAKFLGKLVTKEIETKKKIKRRNAYKGKHER